MKSKYILIIALVMAIVTTVLFRQYLVGLDNKYNNNKNRVSIVTLVRDVNKNEKITKEMLEVKPYSAEFVNAEAVKKVEDIVGSYALVDMKAGEVLLTSRFTNQFKEKELVTRKIQEGYRAVSVEVNYVESVSTLIEPEDYVDVVFSEKLPQGGVRTEIILENVRVLAVGKRIVESGAAVKDEKAAQQADQVEYNSVTVELNSAQVTSIINADERGDIKFVLRSKVAPN